MSDPARHRCEYLIKVLNCDSETGGVAIPKEIVQLIAAYAEPFRRLPRVFQLWIPSDDYRLTGERASAHSVFRFGSDNLLVADRYVCCVVVTASRIAHLARILVLTKQWIGSDSTNLIKAVGV